MRGQGGGFPVGTELDGIRTVEDLKLRCFIDRGSGCWIWRGATSGGLPSMYLPALGRTATAGVAISVLETGEKPPAGRIWYRPIGCSRLCVNPGHRQVGSKGDAMLARGFRHTAATRAKCSQNRRQRIAPEILEEIRRSDEPAPPLAKRLGVSPWVVYRVRSGKTQPLVTSAFSWAAAA